MRFYTSFRGGLYELVLHTIVLGGCDGSLFIFEFPFVEDKVCEVCYCVLVNVFHEGFNASLWDFEVGEFINEVVVYSTSYSCCNSYEGFVFHPWFRMFFN